MPTQEPPVGSLIFVHGSDWISRMIERVTKSKFSHAAVYVGAGLAIEAQDMRTVGYQSLDYYAGEYEMVDIPLNELRLTRGITWLNKQIGRPYDYWDVFVLLVRCLFRFTIPWREGHAILCSRLVRDFLFQAGVAIPNTDMTPGDLYDWVCAYRAQQGG